MVSYSCNNNQLDTTKTLEELYEDSLELRVKQMDRTQLLYNLCEIDTSANNNVSYIPRHGKVLNEATPTIRYIGVESLEEAKNYFKVSIALLPKEEDVDNWTFANIIDIDDCYLEFAESQASGEIARVTIDCPELKSIITDIIFIPRSLWPENDRSSPFQYGSVWVEDNVDIKKSTIYICVRPCAYGQKGIMLTFDRGWGTIKYDVCTYYQGKFELYSNCASYDAINAFASLVNDNPKKFKAVFDAIDVFLTERIILTDTDWSNLYNNGILIPDVKNAIFRERNETYVKCSEAINKKYLHFNIGSPNPSDPQKAEKYWWAKARWYYLVKVGYYVMKYNSEKGRYDNGSWTTTFKEKDTPYNVWPSYSFEFDYDNYPRNLMKVGK